jgi:dolichol-phosphate mannosyltransferase
MLSGHSRSWIGVGICLGLGLLSKYTIALLGPSVFLFLLIDRDSRRWLLRPEPYVACACALLLFSPVIFWNAAHEWASFAFQGAKRWSGTSDVSPHVLVGSVLVILSPIGLVGVLGALVPRWAVALPVAEGTSHNRKLLFSALLTLVPLSVFVLSSFQKPPRINWTGPVWLAVLPLLASSIMAAANGALSGWFAAFNRRVWKQSAVCLLIIYGALLYYVLIGMPGLHDMAGMRLPSVWQEMGREVGDLGSQIAAETGKEPVVTGMDLYGISAELAFYLPVGLERQRIAGRHLVGRESLMWARWFAVSAASGKTVLLVDYHRRDLEQARLSPYFESLGPVGYREITKGGRPVGGFYYRVGYGYRGDKG